MPQAFRRKGSWQHRLSWSLLARGASAALQFRLAENYKELAESKAQSPHRFTLRRGGPECPPTNIEGTRAGLLYERDSFTGKCPQPLLDQVHQELIVIMGRLSYCSCLQIYLSKLLNRGGAGWGKGTSDGNFLLAA